MNIKHNNLQSWQHGRFRLRGLVLVLAATACLCAFSDPSSASGGGPRQRGNHSSHGGQGGSGGGQGFRNRGGQGGGMRGLFTAGVTLAGSLIEGLFAGLFGTDDGVDAYFKDVDKEMMESII